MKILPETATLAKWFGFHFKYSTNKNSWYNLYGHFCFCSCIAIALPMIFCAIKNHTDIVKISEVLQYLPGACNGTVQGATFIWHKEKLKKMFASIQTHVDTRVSQGQGGTFQRVKRPAHMLSMGYIAGMNFVVTCLVAGPLFMVAINWMRQGEIEWRLPTNVLEFPFDESVSPVFEIIYILSSWSVISVCCIVAMGDCNFFILSSLLIASLKDLQGQIKETDERNEREQSKSKRKYQEKIRAHLVKCLKMDLTIKKFISTFSSIWSPIFFIRYLIIISQLCTVVFQLQFRSQFSYDQILSNTIMILVLVCAYFFINYFGNEIILQVQLVAVAAYQTRWYEYSPNLRKYILLMMQHNQQPKYMSGFGMIECSLETFKNVMHMIGSLLTVLETAIE